MKAAKKVKNYVWLRVLRVVSALAFLKSMITYLIYPTLWWFLAIALAFAALALAISLLTNNVPIA